MRQNIIVSIDIGSCNIHAVVAGIHRETGRLEIITSTNIPVKGMRKGIVIDQNELTESLSEVINQLEKKLIYLFQKLKLVYQDLILKQKLAKE